MGAMRQVAVGAAFLAVLCVVLLSSSARSPQVLVQSASTQQLWGGWLSNLDDSVPNNGQAVDIGGRLFMPDEVEPEPKFQGGMFWGHHIPSARPPQPSHARHVSPGLLHELRTQAQAGPPSWWQQKHQAWLAKQIQQQLHPAPPPHYARPSPQPHPARPLLHPALPSPVAAAAPRQLPRPVAAPPAAVASAQAPEQAAAGPSEGQVADAYKKALALQGKVSAAKQQVAQSRKAKKEEAEKKQKTGKTEAAREGEEAAQAAALEHTAASLRQLAKAMDGPRFVASPGRLANIASNLALVSNSLSKDATKEAASLH